MLLWQRGERDEGLRRLRDIARTSPYDVDFGLAPLFIAADLAARSGDDAGAVEGFRRFRGLFIPTAMWRSWALSYSLLVEAESLAPPGTASRRRRPRFAGSTRSGTSAEPDQPLLARAGAVAGPGCSGQARGGK